MTAADALAPRALFREVALLVLGLTSIFLLTHSGFDYSEAVFHYAIAQQIVAHGELSFPEHKEGTYYVAPNGRTYAAHELGNTLILLPAASLNQLIATHLTRRLGASRVEMITRFLFSATGPIVCAVGAGFLYLMLRLLFSQSVRSATLGVIIFVFCSFYWSYTRIMFDGVLSGVLLTGGMLFLGLFVRKPEQDALLIAAFACFGFGVITRLSMVLPIAAAGLYLALNRSRIQRVLRPAVLVVITLAPFVCWQLYYNHLRTGNVFISPVQTQSYAVNNGLGGNLAVGLAGLLFSPGKSVFVYCPIALLSLALIVRFWRAYRDEAVFVSVLTLMWLLLHAKLQSWYGAWGWGPRHFVTIAPVLALPFLVMRFSLRSRVARVVSGVLLGWGFVLAAASNLCNTYYRLGIAYQKGLLENDRFYWSIANNQPLDTVLTTARNFNRMLHGGAYEVLPGSSKINVEASNTVNLWWVTAYHAGMPLVPLTVIVLLLSACAAWSFWKLYRGESFQVKAS